MRLKQMTWHTRQQHVICNLQIAISHIYVHLLFLIVTRYQIIVIKPFAKFLSWRSYRYLLKEFHTPPKPTFCGRAPSKRSPPTPKTSLLPALLSLDRDVVDPAEQDLGCSLHLGVRLPRQRRLRQATKADFQDCAPIEIPCDFAATQPTWSVMRK